MSGYTTSDITKQKIVQAAGELAAEHGISHVTTRMVKQFYDAERGIMRPTWKDREIRLARSGILGFTDAQAQRIQEQVAARLGGESGI